MPDPDFVYYPAPPGVAPSPDFSLTINGEVVFVHHCPSVASVASVTARGALDVEISPAFAFEKVTVRPLSRGITPEVGGDGVIRFTAPPGTPEAPMLLSVEMDEQIRRPLLLLVGPPEENAPRPGDENVLYFEAGKVHEAGRIEIKSGQTVYIAGGAVLRASLFAQDAENIAIRGRGILDGDGHQINPERRERFVHLVGCRNVLVEGITLFNAKTWQIMPAGCDNVTIRDVKIVSEHASDDGIDIVGSQNVTVDGCFVRTKDDCVAIKGFGYIQERAAAAALPVKNVRVQNCVFWNAEWGNALEIGYETPVDTMSDITFRNCDIIRCEAERYGSGGALTIHNGDRAVISDVLYEDLRIEDCQEKLIDFKISFDRYSRDEQRGQIRNITIRNVRVVDGPPPVSIIQGYNRDHIPENITIENLVIHGQTATSAADARMVTEKVRDIQFVADGKTYPLRKQVV